jgi:uncharacterized protein (TIGR00159 family)
MLLMILTPLFEILIIAVVVHYLLSFFWNTRSMDLMIGALAFLLIFAITSWLNLPILYTIMTHVANVAAVAALVIFQPELRVALSKLSLKGKRYREGSEFDGFLEQLTSSIFRLADKRVGALIALEYDDRLDEFAQKAIMLNAKFSSELLESIFATSTPLHDGAVIIRDMTVVAASVILPLAEEGSQISTSMGTRHRAALGICQMTDALVIVISEETGKVSLAREGIMTRGVRPDRFKGIVRSLFTPQEGRRLHEKLSLRPWAKPQA